MAPKSWFQAKVYLPGTGLALMVIAFFFLMQAIPAAMCMLAPRSGWNSPLSQERITNTVFVLTLNPDQKAELDRLNKVLEVAKRNGNQIFVANIEREIAALERGEHSPLIADYLSEEERSGKRPWHHP